MIKVAIAEDNYLLQKVIQEKLSYCEQIEVRIKADNGIDLLDKLAINHHIDLILMDIEMPKMNGILATEKVKNKYPQIKIVILTVFDHDEYVFQAIKAGADGYLLKEVNPEDLYIGITDIMQGGAAMTPSIAMKTLKLLREPIVFENIPCDKYRITSREIEVLEQMSRGLKYEAIALNLFLSVGTIRKHVENIYKKLQVHNKLEAIQKAKRNNLI